MMRFSRAFGILVLFTSLMVLLSSTAIQSQTAGDRLKAGVTDPIYTTLESPPSYIWDCIISRMLIDLQEK
ncbi:MAG: hypothetical protein OEZ30_07595 [Candidatus Aminicenantes bacterium]|nr:hypothetical protein [Candidatus Aminicenantes bacterium]MDH5715409.1 hypothetical protein [Candidatus Aminicenantes bacterium]